MDANGSRYHALVSQADWQGCADASACAGEMEWTGREGNRGGLALRAQLFMFKAIAKRAGGLEESGRGGVFDAYGNLYSLGADRRSLRIRSAGNGKVSDFWPVSGATAGAPAHDGVAAIEGYSGGTRLAAAGTFRPATAASPPPVPEIDAIAVTSSHYLVAASGAAGGLLIFDLHGAGPPLFQDWPALAAAHAAAVAAGKKQAGAGGEGEKGASRGERGIGALVACPDGGIAVLVGKRLLHLGADLKPWLSDSRRPPAFAKAPPEKSTLEDSSLPVDASPPPGAKTMPGPGEIDLAAALPAGDGEVRAVAVLRGCRLLVLSCDAYGECWLGALRADATAIPLARAEPCVAGLRSQLPGALESKLLALRRGDPAGSGNVLKPLAALSGPLPLGREIARIAEIVDAVPAGSTDGGPDAGSPPANASVALASRVLAIDWGANAAAAIEQTLAASLNAPFSFVVVAAGGDQAFRFVGEWQGETLVLAVVREYLPLRHYAGMGLAALAAGSKLHAYPDARVFYASGEAWAPLLAQAQPRYLRAATLETPMWDSALPGCVWHRLAIDLRLPPGTAVAVQTRTADSEDALALADWRAEPPLLRSTQGGDLPWRESGEAPVGTWEVLLQAAHGRWLQARLLVSGDGRQTPTLRALRVWYPRFSYASEYLPPVFRSDPGSADFLDRLLALFEGEFTRWEDRIAAVQWLFDARTAPAASLEWLAGWLGLSFDASDDEARKRLLIRHAMLLHARRGTVPGLLMSATLVWDSSIDEAALDAWASAPAAFAERAHGLRLQEMSGMAQPLPAGAWRPADGRAALLGEKLLNDDPGLVDADELAAAESAGGSFARRAILQRALGFVPRAALEEARLWAVWQAARGSTRSLPVDAPVANAQNAEDTLAAADWQRYLADSRPCAPLRQRWQDFLARRWRRVSALNLAWGTCWRDFAHIPSPVALPAADAALADWHRFEAQVVRALANAHRFRIVLPLPDGELDLDALARRRAAVLRVVEREKPAHTTAEVRFGFDLFRVGEARLGLDTRLEAGFARRPELAALAYGSSPFAPAVLGRTDLGGARLAPTRPQPPADRIGLDRG